MQNSKDFIKGKGLVPFISFKDGSPHTVQLVGDELYTITDQQGNKTEGIKYSVLEDGEEKSFFTSSIALITQLSEVPENSMVKIQMKRRNTDKGIRSYYDVLVVGQGIKQGKEIPVINGEYEGEPTISPEE